MATIFGRPYFEWTDTMGTRTFQLPVCAYTIEWSREWHGKMNVSLDRTYREVDSYGEEYVVTLNGSFMSEANFATYCQPLLDHILLRKEFKFYPHWPTAQRPLHIPAYFDYCLVLPEFKFIIKRSDGVAGWWDFAIEFVSSTPV